MKIAFGTDERTDVTARVIDVLTSAGHQVDVLADGDHWIDVGEVVGQAVASGEADRGIVCCWTGTGVSIAANKVEGVRAARCTDAETARGARRWNDANVLALSLRLLTDALAGDILPAFLATEADASERQEIRRLR